MAENPIPPVVPQLTLPVPQRKDPTNFRQRADILMTELPLVVDGMNAAAAWNNGTLGAVYGYAQSAAQCAVDAETQANLARGYSQDGEASAAAAFASEQIARGYAEDMEDVIAGDTYVISEDTTTIEITGVGTSSNPFKASLKSGEGVLGAPLVSGVGGGVKFEEKALGSWAFANPFESSQVGRAVVIDDTGNLTYAKGRIGDQALAATTPLRIAATSVTAVTYQIIGVNTTSAARTITLPSSPAPGDWVQFFDSHASWDKNNPTIARNGSRIMGKLENMTVDIKGRNFTLTYVDATNGWMITA